MESKKEIFMRNDIDSVFSYLYPWITGQRRIFLMLVILNGDLEHVQEHWEDIWKYMSSQDPWNIKYLS